MDCKKQIIKVNGKSTINVMPDQLELVVELNSLHPTSEEANHIITTNIKKINHILEKLDMQDILAEVSSVQVEKKSHELYDEESQCLRNEVYAYHSKLVILLTMGINRTSICQLIKMIEEEWTDATMKINYRLKDKAQARLTMLANAVEDAKAKAEAIVMSCDYKLESIKEITEQTGEVYPKIEISPSSFFNYNDIVFGSNRLPYITQPKLLVLSGTVSITWNIVKETRWRT